MKTKYALAFIFCLIFYSYTYSYAGVIDKLKSAVSPEAEQENAFIRVAGEVGPAVVNISTEQVEKVRVYSPFEDEFFKDFFRDFFGDIPRGGQGGEREFKRLGLGSGVIIDKEGYILTNEHVVGGATKITVILTDGREFKGVVKGTDSRSDLAVIKIEAHNLPVAELGDSDEVRIGQWAIAIGNPFGYIVHSPKPTVTVGVISALHRSLPRTSRRERDYSDLLQTDAAINPGNSGGPLVDLSGKVIGINVAIFSTSGGYQGMGFAIPINRAKRIIDDLIRGKKIVYGWLGINVQDVPQDIADYYGFKEREGALVFNVLKDTPADKAGIKRRDIIRAIDDYKIKDANDLVQRIGQTKAGQKVALSVLRDGKLITLKAEIGKRPGSEELFTEEGQGPSPKEGEEVKPWRGISVKEITPEIANSLGLDEQQKGVVVIKVEPQSPADEAGLRAGDIIDEIDKSSIDGLNDYKQATGTAKDDALIRTNRGYLIVKKVASRE